MIGETIFSPDRRYRYVLWRDLGAIGDGYLMVIGLNPSTADETLDDPTIRRCCGFARTWGFGGLCMTNLFAFRATDPRVMRAQIDPVGPDNDYWLRQCARGAGMVLAAWGNHGSHMGRADKVIAMLPALQALGVNQNGSPKHPLYARADLQPVPFARAA